MGRSPGFGSAARYVHARGREIAHFALAFAVAPPLNGLTSQRTTTRRLIKQKARGHTSGDCTPPKRRAADGTVLPQLVGIRFQVLLTPLAGVLFIFRSRYLSAIGRC